MEHGNEGLRVGTTAQQKITEKTKFPEDSI